MSRNALHLGVVQVDTKQSDVNTAPGLKLTCNTYEHFNCASEHCMFRVSICSQATRQVTIELSAGQPFHWELRSPSRVFRSKPLLTTSITYLLPVEAFAELFPNFMPQLTFRPTLGLQMSVQRGLVAIASKGWNDVWRFCYQHDLLSAPRPSKTNPVKEGLWSTLTLNSSNNREQKHWRPALGHCPCSAHGVPKRYWTSPSDIQVRTRVFTVTLLRFEKKAPWLYLIVAINDRSMSVDPLLFETNAFWSVDALQQNRS